MQIITSKILPPLPPALAQRYAQSAEKASAGKASGNVNLRAKYCPSMDLIAAYYVNTNIKPARQEDIEGKETEASVAGYNDDDDDDDDDDEPATVQVWRLNGQQVFAVSLKAEGFETARIDVVDVDWRDDGQMLAILSSDNTVRLVSSFTGKIVHSFPAISAYPMPHQASSSFSSSSQKERPETGGSARHQARPILLTYSTLFPEPTSVRRQLASATAESGVVLDDLLSLNADIEKMLKLKADLPRDLASVDVEAFLPRLACLPPPGFGAADVFSTRSSIDTMFHTSHRNLRSGPLDLLCVARDDAVVHLRILDSFEVGDMHLSSAMGLPKDVNLKQVLHVATEPFCHSIAVLAEGSRKTGTLSTHLLMLDLKFLTRAPTTLPILATKVTQLQNLVRYLKQIQMQLARDIKTAFELPERFIRPLNEDLVAQQGGEASFTTAAYHTLVTGEVEGVLKEWLTDVLGDRGVKRWEKAVGDCLELVRRLVSEGWLPAVERAGVVVSRLMGLARSDPRGDAEPSGLGIEKRFVEELRATIDVMAVCGEDLLLVAGQELTGFHSFIRWLKWEAEAAALEDTSERLEEMRENSDYGEILKVLDYIKSGPAGTHVKAYVGDLSNSKPSLGHGLTFFSDFRDERRKNGAKFEPPSMGALLARLQKQCDKMFEQIASTLRQNVMVSHIAELPVQSVPQRILDARLFPQPEYGPSRLHALSVDSSGQRLSELVIDTKRGEQASTGSKIRVTSMEIPQTAQVYDAKFVDATSWAVLAQTEGPEVSILSRGLNSSLEASPTWQIRHTFSQGLMEAGMRPRQLEINGRKNRRAVAVVDGDGRGYVVYDLDSSDPGDGDTTMTG